MNQCIKEITKKSRKKTRKKTPLLQLAPLEEEAVEPKYRLPQALQHFAACFPISARCKQRAGFQRYFINSRLIRHAYCRQDRIIYQQVSRRMKAQIARVHPHAVSL
jgi:hypothetical protein